MFAHAFIVLLLPSFQSSDPHIELTMTMPLNSSYCDVQGDIRYSVRIDRYGRPCPTGKFGEIPPLINGVNTESPFSSFRHIYSLDIRRTGYYEFVAGRLVPYKKPNPHVDTNPLDFLPDETGKIITIDTFLRSEDVTQHYIEDYFAVYGKKAKRTNTGKEALL